MKKISNDEYYKLFCSWQGSGVSKAAFAAKEGISMTSFYYWCRKFEELENNDGDAPGFSRINLMTDSPQNPVIRISYPSGVSIEFFVQIDPDMVRRLL